MTNTLYKGFLTPMLLFLNISWNAFLSEAQYHLAHETGVAFIAAGHHATERYGVQALAAAIEAEFGIPFVFFDDANPV